MNLKQFDKIVTDQLSRSELVLMGKGTEYAEEATDETEVDRLAHFKKAAALQDKLSLSRRSFFDTQWGSTALYAFTDSEGHHFIWKTAFWPDSMTKVNEGDSIVLKGTIKEHNEYKGCKQTVLTRCKIGA